MIVKGAYLDNNRHSAVVVQVKDDKVLYLTYKTGVLELHKTSDTSFTRQFPIFLPDYPFNKAVRSYASSGLKATDNAYRALELLLNPKAAKAAASKQGKK